ncbi:MAG: response regulator [Anaerolineae bacterium]
MPKILIIEDETLIREEVGEWLQFEGYEVISTSNGRMGLNALVREAPDIILCDITMPEMDGLAVFREVRANSAVAHIPFVFLTAGAKQDTMLDADAYLFKPFTCAQLLTIIRDHVK